ncbi:MAG: MOSC domain-containing protein [Rothia sp. (in: high G+C Gram-positive bacteria)]|nr:MOSC domain-containing protein [Rothia sp. (in: high G+C Gram-positive bacteria)]
MNTLTVESFGFAPIKGTRYQPQDDARLIPAGAVGDRQFCLVDVKAQKVLRTVAHPELMAVQCSISAVKKECLSIIFPGKKPTEITVSSAETLECDFWGRRVNLSLLNTEANALFSEYLRKPVVLAVAPTGGIIYGRALSLLGTATVEYLAERLQRPTLAHEHARFRSNLLIKTERPFQEDDWRNQEFKLECENTAWTSLNNTQITVREPIGRCAVINSNPRTGILDSKLFQELAKFRPRNERGEPVAGMYAEVSG